MTRVQNSGGVGDRIFSREEYQRWCEAQPSGRFERDDGRIVEMAPESGAHLRIKGAVYLALVRAIEGAAVACEALPDGNTVEVGDDDYIPDATVYCGERMVDEATSAPNPVIVVEVLSPGTTRIDSSTKLEAYFRVTSIVHYLIVSPKQRAVIHHRREGGVIASAILHSGSIKMDPPGISITVEEIFHRL